MSKSTSANAVRNLKRVPIGGSVSTVTTINGAGDVRRGSDGKMYVAAGRYFYTITTPEGTPASSSQVLANGYNSGAMAAQPVRIYLPSTGVSSFAREYGQKTYEIKDHLDNVRVTFTDVKNYDPTTSTYTASLGSVNNYYAFGGLEPSRTWGAESYRFGFNGQEMDNEVSGTGNTNTAMFWEYDTRLGRRWNMDPKPQIGISEYACFGDNPVFSVDILGDTVTVTTRAGKYLFKLDWGGTNNFTVTVQALYAFGVQWWEPQANYYVPLLEVADDIEVRDELKHFNWSDLVNYGLVDRNSWDYRQQGSGDWKWKSDGADEYLLTEIDGIPYWSDALGQIPFTVDTYLDCREDDGLNHQDAAAETVKLGQDHAGGQLYGGSSEVNSSYDNLMILRVILLAGKISRGNSSDYKDLGNPVSQQDASKFGYTHPSPVPSFEQVKQFFGL